MQTYHDWCTCAPICHLMSQLSVQQGHVYEGDNRSGWRRERNLKSLSLSLSFSRRVVAPYTVNADHIIRKHTYTERCVLRTRACIRLLHFSTHKTRTLWFTCIKYLRLSEFPVKSRETIREIPARSSALIPRGFDQ